MYRTLDVFAEADSRCAPTSAKDRVFDEPAREHPHHHPVCERCGAVHHVHDDVLGDLAGRIEVSTGYALAERGITLFGTCPDCRLAR